MKANPRKEISLRLLWILVLLLLLIVLFLLPDGVMMLGGIWFWLILLPSLLLIWSLLGEPAATCAGAQPGSTALTYEHPCRFHFPRLNKQNKPNS